MITQEQIGVLANKFQTTELNIRREYLQHLFLSYFYKQPQAASVYFKGGTALRVVYQSPRFSEDLDFSTTLFEKDLEQIVLLTLQDIEKEGVATRLEEAKPTSGGYFASTAYWAFDQTITISLQISLREGEKTGEVTTIVNDFILPYTAVVLAKQQLAAEKIQALLTRQKPRDFYDCYFMLRANLLGVRQRSTLKQVLAVLRKSEINFEHELKQFLPKNQWPIIRNFSTVLVREIQRFL